MIYGIGRNYAKHAKELGNAPSEESPIVFFKPPACGVSSDSVLHIPPFTQNLHFEGEIAYRLGKDLEPEAICIALDMTARDQQKIAQEKKLPWSLAKGFKQSCALGSWHKVGSGFDWSALELKLFLNEELKQHGYAKDMIFTIPQINRYLQETFPMEPGDIVLTGTPEGVGAVKPGDIIKAEIPGLSRGTWSFK